jgi:glycosyltransferase involved in cell wall biosynthesis
MSAAVDCSVRRGSVFEADGSLRGLRIAFVAGTLGQGGAERQLFYILRALKRSGASPALFTLSEGEFWESRIRALGIPVRIIPRAGSRLGRLSKLIRGVVQSRPDMIQSQHFYTNTCAGMAARAARRGSIGAIRNDVHSEIRDSGRVWGALHLRLPTMLAANSRAAVRTLESLGSSPGRCALLPNVVDTSDFQPAARGLEEGPAVLGIGRLAVQKRFDRFLEVLARVRRRFGPVRGVIAGAGPLQGELEQHARGLGLTSEAIQFAGPVTDVRPLLRKASVLLLSSDHEGTPNVLLEAMASGVPVVATRVGDVPELIADGRTGRICAPEDVEGLAMAVGECISRPEVGRRLNEAARRLVRETRSTEALAGLLARLYQTLEQRRNGRTA